MLRNNFNINFKNLDQKHTNVHVQVKQQWMYLINKYATMFH